MIRDVADQPDPNFGQTPVPMASLDASGVEGTMRLFNEYAARMRVFEIYNSSPTTYAASTNTVSLVIK